MRRSGCRRINVEALLEQASGRVHSPVDRSKTKGGFSGENNETGTFPGAKGITGNPEFGIGICAICGLKGVSHFKKEVDSGHGCQVKKKS